jgi:capsular exopolysaccharide synthesis family protein
LNNHINGNNHNGTDREAVNNPSDNTSNTSMLPADADARRLAINGSAPLDAGTRVLLPHTMREQEESDLDLRQLLGVFLRRWKVMLATFLTVVIGTIIYTWTATPIYEAKSTIQVESSKGARFAGMQDLPVLGDLAGLNDARSQENEVEVIKSAVVQGPALKRLTEEQQKAVKPYPVTVSPIRNTELLVIAARSHDPEAAAARANAIAQEYIDRSLYKARGQVSEAANYVHTQMKDVRQNLDRARLAMQKFKEQNRTVELPVEAQAKIQQLSTVESNLKEAEADYAASIAQVQQMKSMAARMPATTRVPSGYVVSPDVAAMKEQLSKLELQKVDLLATYQPTSRKVREVQGQINNLNKQLSTKAQFSVESYKNDTNPVRLTLDQSIAQTQGTIQALEARSKALEKLADRTRQELAQLPGLESRLSQLTGDLETYQQAYQSLGEKYQQLQISIKAREANAEVLSAAVAPGSPIKPRKITNLLAAVVLGTLLAFLLAAVLERLDDRVHSDDEVTQITQLPVLAHVPLIEEGEKKEMLVGAANPNPLLREGFRMLRTNISFMALDAPIRSLVMTSTQPGEGKSVSSVNLAITAAQGGESVILVDCDLRRPSVHRLLGLPNKVGYTSVVSGACSLEEALQETNIPNLRVLSSGPVPPDSFALLKSRAGQACFKQIFAAADFVVLDTPPALIMADAQLVASVADAVLLVVSSKEAAKRDIARTRDLLAQTGAGLLGVVFNKASDGAGGYYDYYKYRYYSHYFKPEDEDAEQKEESALEKADKSK